MMPQALYTFFKLSPRRSAAHATNSKLSAVLDEFQINTLDRVAMFLAQTGHETDQYNTFSGS
jgi:predicted chitinase